MRPAILIAIIGAALAFVIGVDVWGAQRAQHSANQIFDNATRSIELVQDMRWQLHQLAHAEPNQIKNIVAQIDVDIAAYSPLATFENEGEIWGRVRDMLSLSRDAALHGELQEVRDRNDALIEAIQQLVIINNRESRVLTDAMNLDRRYEIWGDIIAVIAASVVIVILALRLSRAQAHERTLLAERVSRIEDRNRELDAFAGRAAHDLRAPLNPIRGYAELIATDANVPPETRRQASLITKAVLRMTRVIDDMLALSRAGHPEPGRASVPHVFARVREELDAELQDVAIDVDLENVEVGCNETSLEQVFRNLFGNAAKFRSPERKLTLTVSAHRKDGAVEIGVADNGVGMDAETMAHAFDPFYRGRRDIAGTGLGLSIVERIARASGGTCRLDAEHAPGTRVVLTLPAI